MKKYSSIPLYLGIALNGLVITAITYGVAVYGA